MPGPEATIETRATERAVECGWLEIKIMRANKKGWPDHLYIRAGRFVFVEYKQPGETPTKQQALRHKELNAQGVEVYWLDNLEDAYAVFE